MLAAVVMVAILPGTPPGHTAEPPSFADGPGKILQRRCLRCHSDEEAKGDFSVSTAEAFFDSGYVVKGDAAGSYLVELITSQNGKAQMPRDGDPLSPKELALIRDWINRGASWPTGVKLEPPVVDDFDWWSYRPLRRPELPADTSWSANEVDRFIFAKLQQQGLSPSPPADRRTLIRRVTYDLIGLPPTPEETAAFIADDSPDAYEKLVNRLLDSPHYGERWARHWLDVVKYADTCGYDKDKLRPHAWPYRDYVIRSLNEDKPYARFVQEQIAGDVLFPGEPDGVLGLGFIAAGPWDFIGHVEVPESKIDGKVARNLDRDDMVSNVLNTFCSVTIQCARCHHHKFDPITQQDYYGLQAIFAAVDRAERPYDVSPATDRQRRELVNRKARLEQSLADWRKETETLGGDRWRELNERVQKLEEQVRVEKSHAFGYHSAISKQASTPKWVELELPQPLPQATFVLHPCHDDYANIGAGFGFPPRFHVEVSLDGQEWRRVLKHADGDFANPGLAPVEGKVARPFRRLRVTATRLAPRSNDYIFALAEVEVLDANGDNAALQAKVHALDSIEALPRWGRGNLIDGQWAHGADPAVQSRLTAAQSALAKLREEVVPPKRQQRREQLETELKATVAQLKSLPTGKLVYAAATDFKPQGNFKPTGGKPRPIHVLERGNVTQPAEPAVPAVLPLAPGTAHRLEPELDEGQRRAALAQWLTSKDHPLVWRSIVNRVWQHHFGVGLVATPNDFGRMGAKPSHPQLLDWLAATFRDNGQSLKQLHRMMVMSAAYRQSSAHRPAMAEMDGANRHLWRMNRRRLAAEEIRDAILMVSGALNRKMGGPGFYLFELEKTAHSPHYEYHKFDPSDSASHRRSIYRFIVRSQPDPWMTTLDCADSSQSTPRRNETLTSLQALALLNNRFNLTMAERFAERLRGEFASADDRIRAAMQAVTQRDPSVEELQAMRSYADEHGLPNLCRMLFNLTEFVYLD